jgi:NADPH-dependent 2,4-dienoyl-CoA reductase/sulfur reductase-like enzyme
MCGIVAAMAQPDLQHVVVVGASLAGLRACEALRTDGFTGRVTLIGAEPHLPYDRPPLSKKVLAGDWEPDRIALRPSGDLDALGLDVRLGVPAAALDLDGRAVTLADGTVVPFDGLIIATGSATRRLPGQADVPIVHELRTLDDSLALRARIADGTARVVVIGAGFIGLEVAATARARGCTVTVLEGLPAPLIRGLGAEMGAAATAAHADGGIDIRCDVTVAELLPDGVRLADGTLVPADVVVVGIGVAPATGWLDGSGLTLRDGIVCDATLAAGPPGVYAAGDVARWPNGLFDDEMRIEHWTNAAEQGAAAARNLLATAGGGTPEAYSPVPFFWSDQARHRIQFLGRSATADEGGDIVEVVVGATGEHRFLALYGRRGRLWGALGVNAPRWVMPYGKLIEARASWDDALRLAAEQRAAQQS